MSNDQFSEAVHLISQAVTDHGPHILILADQASCYYMLNDYDKFVKLSESTKENFNLNQRLFSDSTLVKSSLALGKLLEESGSIHEAIEMFKAALSQNRNLAYPQILKIRAQLLRLGAAFNIKKELDENYQICEKFFARDGNCEIDLQHALIMADFVIFGQQPAEDRLRGLLSRTKLTDSEYRLLVFDLFFEIIKTPAVDTVLTEFYKKFIEKIDYFKCDPFEKALIDVYFDRNKKAVTEPIDLARTEQLSPLCALRYLYLVAMSKANEQSSVLAKKKFIFLCQNLDGYSRKLIEKTWTFGGSLNPDNLSVSLRVANSCFYINGHFFDEKKNELLLSLLKQFKNTTAVENQDLIKNLYALDHDEHSFQRLRIFLQRQNKKLASLVSANKMFSISKSAVKLNVQIQLIN